MNTTWRATVLAVAGLVISIIFLILAKRERNKSDNTERDNIMYLQNLFNIPLCISVLCVHFISPTDDPMLGLWGLTVIAIAIPTIICYITFGMVIPGIRLSQRRKKPRPKLYWANVAVLIAELLAAQLFIR